MKPENAVRLALLFLLMASSAQAGPGPSVTTGEAFFVLCLPVGFLAALAGIVIRVAGQLRAAGLKPKRLRLAIRATAFLAGSFFLAVLGTVLVGGVLSFLPYRFEAMLDDGVRVGFAILLYLAQSLAGRYPLRPWRIREGDREFPMFDPLVSLIFPGVILASQAFALLVR